MQHLEMQGVEVPESGGVRKTLPWLLVPLTCQPDGSTGKEWRSEG